MIKTFAACALALFLLFAAAACGSRPAARPLRPAQPKPCSHMPMPPQMPFCAWGRSALTTRYGTRRRAFPRLLELARAAGSRL